MADKAKDRVAAATMSAGAAGKVGGGLSGKAIEQAMGEATVKALAEGITDPAEILKLKLAARERVKAEHRSAVEKAAKEAAKAD